MGVGGKRTKGGPGPAAFPAGLLRAFMSCSTPGLPRERPRCTGVPKPTCPQNPCCRNVSQKRAPRLPQETRSETGGPRPGWSSRSDTGLPWDPMESVQGHTGPLIPGRLGRKGPGVPRGNRAPCLGPRNHGSRRRTLVGERWPEPPPPEWTEAPSRTTCTERTAGGGHTGFAEQPRFVPPPTSQGHGQVGQGLAQVLWRPTPCPWLQAGEGARSCDTSF